MKTYFYSLVIILVGISACEKEEAHNSFNKQLGAIKENGKLITEFKYDSLKRLVELNNYYNGEVTHTESYQYNSDNKLIQRNFNGIVERYQYSGDGKLNSTKREYDAAGKEWIVEYQYDHDQISKAVTYFNGLEEGYITFKYDSRGNTTERTEYAYSNGHTYIASQFKLSYDGMKNPLKNMSIYPIDIMMNNNPIYFYRFVAVMSSFPPEYNITYDYNDAGFPAKEYRDSHTFYYEYIDTN